MNQNNRTSQVEVKLRVRYAETDQMGHAYYANYLTWFEVISLPKSIVGCLLIFSSAVVLMVFNYRENNLRHPSWQDMPPAAGATKSFGCDGGHSIQTK